MIPSTRCSPSTSVTELPAYWRVIALDKYDGELWTLEDGGEPAEELAATDRHRASATSSCRSSRFSTSDPHWLPAAYHPVEINLENTLVVPESATMYLKPASRSVDLAYEVTSEMPVLTEAEKSSRHRRSTPSRS